MKGLRAVLVFMLTMLSTSNPVAAQVPREVVAEVLAQRDSLEEAKTFRFGLSVGWRLFLGSERFTTSATINPADSTVRVDTLDESDVILSGVVVAYPFKPTGAERSLMACAQCGLGFTANLTLASFSAEALASFNQSIEGGIGIAAALSSDFALSLTLERDFRRRLRDFVEADEKLMAEGEPVLTLSRDDDRFFVDDNVTAISVKFVYFF